MCMYVYIHYIHMHIQDACMSNEAGLCSGEQQEPRLSLGGAPGQVVRKVSELYGHSFNFEDYKVQHGLQCSETFSMSFADMSGFTSELVAKLCIRDRSVERLGRLQRPTASP